MLELPAHLHRLVATTFSLGPARATPPAAAGPSAAPATCSRRVAVVDDLRRLRMPAGPAGREGGERPVGTTIWRFEGVGLRCEIDRMLARGIEEHRREGANRSVAGGGRQRIAARQEPDEALLDSTALAERLGITERHVRRLVAERRIPFVKVGRFVRFEPADVAKWLQGARVEALR